ncbi:hypothetical protein IW140_004332 [Coemansia sp. RSA 1813]|nr:hypothetical protein EV178_004405 [Coemansia sp. RSA 1646]KAJ2087985.1 hypothetical protein IW138_004582 [Coemansia sp. RSA 986]KAJ2211320.1 hypothetical protein EV179_005587 [Coemansia sp. RSA 487]KAJ2567822.1 hypothetical protein IW140_004332 [Coemansia sp. RSA 1813]
MVVPRNAPHNPMEQRSEDEELVHAMARQYVLDAEAAGSAPPSHRSRRDTDVSRMPTDRSLGGDIVTTSSEDYPMPVPQLPQLRHAVGKDNDSDQSSGGGYRQVSEKQQLQQQEELMADNGHYNGRNGSLSSEKYSRSSGSVPPVAHHIALGAIDRERALSDQLRDEEVEDDANEARLFVPVRLRYPPPRYSVKPDSSIPAGAVLFACGFILLPLWWIGAVFPRTRDSDVARTWRKYNALMTLLSLPLLGLFLALGGWQATHN